MIGVEHHDEIGPRGGELLLLRAEQFRDFAIGSVAFDEMRKYRRVRHAEPGNDLRHVYPPVCRCRRYATGWPISSTFTARMRSL